MKVETYKCDIDKCENEATYIGTKLQVIFRTEQTEGRPIKGSIAHLKLDLCKDCYLKVLDGVCIDAYGAQGFNKYFFKNSVSPDG